MGALPKRKISKRRRDQRRANDFLTPVTLTKCPSCGEMIPTHHACPACGRYKNRQVINVK